MGELQISDPRSGCRIHANGEQVLLIARSGKTITYDGEHLLLIAQLFRVVSFAPDGTVLHRIERADESSFAIVVSVETHEAKRRIRLIQASNGYFFDLEIDSIEALALAATLVQDSFLAS